MSGTTTGSELSVAAAAVTDRGRRRTHNEDVAIVRDDLNLYIVADGAGGHNAGDVAADLATRSIVRFFQDSESRFQDQPDFDQFGFPSGARRLSAAIHEANRDVLALSRSSQQHRGMGTTVVSGFFAARSGLLHVAHVGDSRCYRYRAPHLELLTQDHSLLTDVLEQRPGLEDVVLARLPRHVVTRALGMDEQLRVSMSSHALAPGDRYLLCSDGLSSVVTPEEIVRVLALREAVEDVAYRLVELANAAGGPDNVSALVLECTQAHGSDSSDSVRQLAASIDDFEEDPEILILGIEELDPNERPYTASDGLLQALGELIKRGK
jgi:protein phosphatase